MESEFKFCSKCKTIKEISFFSKDKKSKDGLNGYCRECIKKNRENRKQQTKEYRKIYNKEHRDEINEANRAYRLTHKEQHKEYNREYDRTHKDHRNEYAREWRKRSPDKARERQSRYRLKHLDKIKKYNIDLRKKHPEHSRINTQRRIARIKEVASTLTVKEWVSIKKSFNGLCAYCGKEGKLEQEHFISVSKGGEYTHNNIIPVCKSCNRGKSSKSFFEWYPKQPFYSKTRERKILKFLNYKNGKQQLAFPGMEIEL